MRFAHLAEQLYLTPWYITDTAHATLRMVFERAVGSGLDFRVDEGALASLFPQRRKLSIDSEGLADVHVLGPLGKGLSKMEQSCGATSFESVRADLSAAQKAGARGVLMHFENAPGGTVMGTPETAKQLAELSTTIPVVAFTEDTMASGAYYLGAGARAIVASESSQVGSIGVYMPWVDRSAQLSAQGIKPDPIVNQGGDLKAIGFTGKLSDAQREFLQGRVDANFADFREHVRNHRDVADSAMRGQALRGKDALAANLVDALGDKGNAIALLHKFISAGSKLAA